jgi:glycine betaine/proline transport system ATP-binding protein
MNPLSVLCARDLIEPCTHTPEVNVSADTDVREVMKKFGRADVPVVGVMDDGKLIGQISTDRILAKLINPRN